MASGARAFEARHWLVICAFAHLQSAEVASVHSSSCQAVGVQLLGSQSPRDRIDAVHDSPQIDGCYQGCYRIA